MTLAAHREARDRVVLLVCCAALFMTTLDGTILNVALPSLQRHLHASPSGLQWTVDGYTLFRACAIFLCGAVADRFGRKRMFCAGLVMFTVGSIACGLAPNLGTLIGFRCFQGFGSAVLTPSSLAIITYTFTEQKRRAWAIGMWNVASGVSTTGGPIIGGFLVQLFGWRSVFLVNVPVGIAALVGTKIVVESRSPRPRPFDIPGQLAIGISLASLTYGLITAPDDGWGSPLVLSLFAVALACAVGFLLIQRYSAHPLIALNYLAQPALSGAALLAILAFTVVGGFQFLNTLYLQEVRGYSPLHAGLALLPLAATVVVVAPLAGKMTGSDGPRRPAALAGVFLTVGLAVLAGVIGLRTSIAVLLVVYLLLGISNGLVNTPITTAAISSMPRGRAAVAGAVGTTGRQIGSNLGVALIGSIVFSVASLHGSVTRNEGAAFVHGLRYGYVVATVLALVSIAVALWAFRPGQLHPAWDEDDNDDVEAAAREGAG